MRLAGCYHTQINGETGEVLEPFRCDIIGGSKEKYDFETLRKLVPIHIKPEKKAIPIRSWVIQSAIAAWL